MKLISLNTWGGKYFNPLISFIQQHLKDTDIFCFQEIKDTETNIKQLHGYRLNLLSEIKQILTNFQVFYLPVAKSYDDQLNKVNIDLTFGSAIFIKNSIKVTSYIDHIVSEHKGFIELKKDFSNLPTPLQEASFKLNDKEFTVFNFHGPPRPGNKLDTPRRLWEIKNTKEIIDQKSGSKILVGDFNLLPETQSIKIIENNMRNLIKEFHIERTRSNLSPYFGKPDFQKFADYAFVFPEVDVKNFEVPDVQISDHLPMILEFS